MTTRNPLRSLLSTRYCLILLVVLSSIGFSTKGVLAKLSYQYGIPAVPLLSLRMLLASPLFGLVLLLNSGPGTKKLTVREHLVAVLNGFLGLYFSAMLDFKGLQYITAGLERTILFSYPTLIILINCFFLAQSPTRKQVFAVALSYIGLIIAFIADWQEIGPGIITGSALVFGCAVSFALYMIGSAQYVSRYGALRYTSLVLLWATIMTSLHTALLYPPDIYVQPIEVYQIVALMAVIATVFPTLMLAVGLKNLGATNSAVISSVGPVSTIFLSSWLLNEQITSLQVAGAGLVIAGVIVIASERERGA